MTEPISNDILHRNIEAVHQRRTTSDELRRKDQVFVDRVSSFAGSTLSLYVHLAFYFGWIVFYCSASQSVRRATFASEENIALCASLEAIFLAVFVLANQKRMNALERKNSDLHLQMSLLTEHEITRLAQMVALVGEKCGADMSRIQGIKEFMRDIHPDEIIEKIISVEESSPTDLTNDGQVK